MGIGIASKCKVNANIGNSATSSNINEELKKLHHAVHYGALLEPCSATIYHIALFKLFFEQIAFSTGISRLEG
jgi:hypothetical protein